MNLRLLGCIAGVLLVSTVLLNSCSNGPYPPVEIMGATMGIIEQIPGKPARAVRTNIVPLTPGQKYAWVIYLRTNREKLRYSEHLELAGPASWGVGSGAKYEISPDKKTITLEREKTKDIDFIVGMWTVAEGDPPGKASFTITIEGKVQHKFEFELKKPTGGG
jgi:hypothetical protein